MHQLYYLRYLESQEHFYIYYNKQYTIFSSGSDGKEFPCNMGDQVPSLGQEDALEKEIATHSCIIAREMPWMEEAGRYSSWGCKKSDITEQLYFLFYVSLHLLLNSSKTVFILEPTRHCLIYFLLLFVSIFGFLSRPPKWNHVPMLCMTIAAAFCGSRFLRKEKPPFNNDCDIYGI